MMFRVFLLGLLLLLSVDSPADGVQGVITNAMKGLEVRISDDPYSRTIERMMIGYSSDGAPRIGIAYREIKSFEPITGVVIVEKTEKGFILREALFPDISNIKAAKDRKQVLTVLQQFRNVPFDPHAEKSAVDGLTGATRHGIKTSGYLNYMARRTALEMEAGPDWPERKSVSAPTSKTCDL